MSETKSGLQIVAAPASGWCDPDTGLCHIDATDEATADEAAVDEAAVDEDPAGDVRDAPQR